MSSWMLVGFVTTEPQRELWHWLLFFFGLSSATPAAYGGSQARGLIGAVAAGLRQNDSNARSEPDL